MGMGGNLLWGKILMSAFWKKRIAATGFFLSMLIFPLFSEDSSIGNAEFQIAQEILKNNRPMRQIPAKIPVHFAWHGLIDTPLTIDGFDRELTQHYIKEYSAPGGLSWLKSVMERSEPYIGFVQQEINKMNLPPELAYLPVIESSYLSTAMSKSGAAGLWQFMTNSIAPFDIHVTDWIDERRDFWKSTLGALRKLQDNYNYFHDWPMALAAYNAGLGAMQRFSRNAGTSDYWELSERKILKTETIHYVPKLLAVSHILMNAGTYGIDLGWPENPHWERIALDRSVDVTLLAERAGINPEELRLANRELNYNITPPGSGYFLKVKAADVASVQAVLDDKTTPLVKYYIHSIRSGDTLSALSRHYEVSVAQIQELNAGLEPQFLKIGQTLIIPALKDIGPYTGIARRNEETLTFDGTHLVKKGETLWSISLAYEVDPEMLAEANNMQLNDTLREGRSLKTPTKRE
jgi:membrane-bound lytic murein transglycosylase D